MKRVVFAGHSCSKPLCIFQRSFKSEMFYLILSCMWLVVMGKDTIQLYSIGVRLSLKSLRIVDVSRLLQQNSIYHRCTFIYNRLTALAALQVYLSVGRNRRGSNVLGILGTNIKVKRKYLFIHCINVEMIFAWIIFNKAAKWHWKGKLSEVRLVEYMNILDYEIQKTYLQGYRNSFMLFRVSIARESFTLV